MCLNSLKRWFTSKPPLIVFLLTLFLCVFILLGLLVHLEVNKRCIPNPNVRDWNSFYKKLSRVEFCLPFTPVGIPENFTKFAISQNISEMVSMKALVDINFLPHLLDVETRIVDVQSTLSSHNIQLDVPEEMIGKKAHLGHKQRLIRMTISDLEEDDSTRSNLLQTCVKFEGAADLLPDVNVTPATCELKKVPSLAASFLDSCNGSTFGFSLIQKAALTPLLNETAIGNIESHLMSTVIFLLSFILSVFLFSFCCTKQSYQNEEMEQIVGEEEECS